MEAAVSDQKEPYIPRHIRVINEDGRFGTTRIMDADKGGDVMHVAAVALEINPAAGVQARLTILKPRVDVVAEVASVTERCPRCGHEEQRAAAEPVSDAAVIQAMVRYGGSSVEALGRAAAQADPGNLELIKAAFPKYWSKYSDTVRQLMREDRG